MIKRVSLSALVVCLSLVLLSPSLVQAQSGLTILDSSLEVEFPSSLNFNLSAESDVNITDIRLYYTVDRVSYAQVTSEVYIEFVPSTVVEASWAWDMRKTGGLPPGTGVEYWWTVEDANGNEVETTPVRVQFDDTRYPWHSLTEGNVTIYWYEGEQSFARELMAAAQQALTRLDKDTGAHLEKAANIYLYASHQDLIGAMIYPQTWTGGVTFSRYGTIVIGIAPETIDWGKRAIAHELSHLVIHQLTLNPYDGLPVWLSEGLAMYAEGAPEPRLAAYLDRAMDEKTLISVRSLSSPFSSYAEQSYLSYAQSYSLVEFLINNYGQGKMLELLSTFEQGGSYDEAMERVYSFDMDGLDTRWQEYITRQYRPAVVPVTLMPPALIGVLSALAAVLLLWLGLVIEDWAWRRGW